MPTTLADINASSPSNQEEIRLGASRIREGREAEINTVGTEHHLTGEHKFPAKNGADFASLAVKDGRLALDGNALALELYLVNAVTLSGAGTATFAATTTVTGLGTSWASGSAPLRPGMLIYNSTDDGVGSAVAIAKVNSDTEIILSSAYGGTVGAGKAWTAVVAPAGWNKVGTLRFEEEHNPTGSHNFPFRTDLSEPPDVENGNLWFYESGGEIGVKYRTGGITKTVSGFSSAKDIIFFSSAVTKVNNLTNTSPQTVSIAADTGADTAKIAIFTFSMQSKVISSQVTGTASLGKDGNFPIVLAGEAVDSPQPGDHMASGMVFVPVNAAEEFQWKTSNTNTGLTLALVGYIK
jgi:hypothetical protein